MNNTDDISLIGSICVVIPTFNRADILAQSLAKYAEVLHIENASILVVDNNSSDNTAQVVIDFKQDSRLNIQYIFEENQGLSFAKNAALKHCKQEFILFLDDDCYPQEDILLACAKNIAAGNKVVVGKIKRWDAMVEPWNLDEFYIQNCPSEKPTVLKTSTYFRGGVLLIAASLVRELNGFDTNLGMKGNKSAYGEDTDLAKRLLSDKQSIFYDPSIAMYHKAHQNSVGAYLRAYYTLGKTEYGGKHSKFVLLLKAILSVCKFPFVFISTFFSHWKWKTAMVKSLIPVANSFGRLAGA